MAARSAVLDSEPLQTLDGCGLPTDCCVVGPLQSSHEISVASRPTSEFASRFSRALDSLGLSEVILGSRNLATSVSLGRKGAQETCTNSKSPPSGRSVFPDISAEPLSVRLHPRTGGHSFKLPDSGQSLTRLRLEQQQQQRGGGARGASGPPRARVSGGGFGRGRARSRPLKEGVWRVVRWAVTRPHSDPRPEKGRANTAQHRARQRTHARARHTRAPTGVSRQARRDAQHSTVRTKTPTCTQHLGSSADLHLPTTARVSV